VESEAEQLVKMTTPRWTRKAYFKAILATLLVLLLLVTFVICLSNFGAFSSSSASSQAVERHEAPKTSSLKSLVASFLRGESAFMFIYENPNGDLFGNEVDVMDGVAVCRQFSSGHYYLNEVERSHHHIDAGD
jgi:hypothetical protein